MNKSALQAFAQDCLEDLDTATLEAETKIVEWGKWSRGGIPTGKAGDGITPNISDDEALLIDRQVGKLKEKYFRSYFVIIELYRWGRGLNDLAGTLGISNRKVQTHRDKGLSIIYGGLQEALDTVR